MMNLSGSVYNLFIAAIAAEQSHNMFKSKMLSCAIATLLLSASIGNAAVLTVNIDDLTEGVPTVSSPDNIVFSNQNDTTADFLHFRFQSKVLNGPVGLIFRKDFLEVGSGALSDRALFTFLNEGILDVQFDSRDIILLPVVGVFLGADTETGAFQQVWSVGDTSGNSVFFNARSDVESLPEPGSLALFGLGLAGLGFIRRKKA